MTEVWPLCDSSKECLAYLSVNYPKVGVASVSVSLKKVWPQCLRPCVPINISEEGVPSVFVSHSDYGLVSIPVSHNEVAAASVVLRKGGVAFISEGVEI